MGKRCDEEKQALIDKGVKMHLRETLLLEGYVPDTENPDLLRYGRHMAILLGNSRVQIWVGVRNDRQMLYNEYYSTLWDSFFAMCEFMQSQRDAEFRGKDLDATYDE